ncbi:MAG: metallophosphoesterase [Microbacteriaceae bacterium]
MSQRIPERGHQVLIQLSDLHYQGNDELFSGRSMSGTFADIRRYCDRSEYAPDAIVVTGDLIHRDGAGNYADVNRELQELGQHYQIPVVVTFGNHDRVAEAGEYFPLCQSLNLQDYRLIVFDNSAPEITADQVNWLSEQLLEPYRSGTLLAFHHSPVPSPVPGLGGRGMEQTAVLEQILRGSDVVQLLTGHYHHAQSSSFAGIPCWTSPALANHQMMDAPLGQVGAVKLSGFSVVELYPTAPVITPVWLNPFDQVFLKNI